MVCLSSAKIRRRRSTYVKKLCFYVILSKKSFYFLKNYE